MNLWDLGKLSSIATQTGVAAPPSCNACPGPHIELAPNGDGVAVSGGNGDSLAVQTSTSGPVNTQWAANDELSDFSYAPRLWIAGTDHVVVIEEHDGSAKIVAARPGLPVVGSWAPTPNPFQLADRAAAVRPMPDGQHAIEITDSGTIKIRTLTTGDVVRQLDGPRSMAPTVSGQAQHGQDSVAIDPSANYTAIFDYSAEITGEGESKIYVTTVATGAVHEIAAGDVAGITFTNEHLLVQRKSGALEIWNPDGSSPVNTIRGVSNTSVGPVSDGRDTVVEVASDQTAQVIDYPSGSLLGTLLIPTGGKNTSTGLVFSANGDDLVTVTESRGADGTTGDIGEMVDWKMNPQIWIRLACESVGRDLTPAEWTLYTGSSALPDLRCRG